jgi:hypothetical protein
MNARRSGAALATASVLVIGATVTPEAALGQRFDGLVAEQLTLVPAHGAVVTLFRALAGDRLDPVGMTTTDADGAFSLAVPGPGAYRVQADLEGLSSAMSPRVDLADPSDVGEVALILPSQMLQHAFGCEALVAGSGGAVVGTVRESGTGVALPGVRVFGTWREGPLPRTTEIDTDEAGRYRLCPPRDAGPISIETLLLGEFDAHPGVEVTTSTVVIHDLEVAVESSPRMPRDVLQEHVLMEAAALGLADLSGEILDRASGAPAPYVVLKLRGTHHQALGDERGRFAFEGLTPGTYTLEVRSLGYDTASDPIEIPAGKDVFVRMRVEPQALELDGLEVTVRSAVEEVTRITPFRRNIVYGARMARAEERGARAYEVLRSSAPGLRISERWTEWGPPTICVETNRRLQSLDGGCHNVQVVVDGMRIPDGPEFLYRTPAAMIESIEFITPVQAQILYGIGGNTANGVVAIYTRGKGPYASPVR